VEQAHLAGTGRACVARPRDARRFETDANETVGEITVGGTISLMLFVGLGGGLLGATRQQ